MAFIKVRAASLVESTGGGRTMAFVVSLTGPLASDVSFDYRTVSGTAQEVVDFDQLLSRATFAAGENLDRDRDRGGHHIRRCDRRRQRGRRRAGQLGREDHRPGPRRTTR